MDVNDPDVTVSLDVLAAVIDAVPGKTVEINTDLSRVWGRKLVTEEIDSGTLRISLQGEKDSIEV